MAFALWGWARLPLHRLPADRPNGAAGFTSCCGLVSCSAPLRTPPLDDARGPHYRGPWRLPEPDSHRLAALSLSLGYVTTTSLLSWRPSCWTHPRRADRPQLPSCQTTPPRNDAPQPGIGDTYRRDVWGQRHVRACGARDLVGQPAASRVSMVGTEFSPVGRSASLPAATSPERARLKRFEIGGVSGMAGGEGWFERSCGASRGLGGAGCSRGTRRRLHRLGCVGRATAPTPRR